MTRDIQEKHANKSPNSSKNERSQYFQKFESVAFRDVWKNTNAGFVNFQKPKAMRSLWWGIHVKIELCFEKYEGELFFFGNKMTQLGSEPLGFVKIELYGKEHENPNFTFGKGMFANKASALDFKNAWREGSNRVLRFSQISLQNRI